VTEIVQPADPGDAAEHAEPDDALEANLAIVDGVLVVGQVSATPADSLARWSPELARYSGRSATP